MKNKLALTTLISIFGLIAAGENITNVTVRRYEVIQLWSEKSGYTDTNGNYQYDGAKVTASSSSKGAPKFPQGVIIGGKLDTNVIESAEVIAQCLNAGYSIKVVDTTGLYLTLVKENTNIVTKIVDVNNK